MSDLFHDGISHAQRAAICGAMLLAPAHTYQVLTKRPRTALDFVRWVTDRAARSGISPTALMGCAYFSALGVVMGPAEHERVGRLEGRDPFPWWLGVSVEDQATADGRIPLLLECPAAVRWVSYEPAIGPVDFKDITTSDPTEIMLPLAGLTWRMGATGTRVSRTHPKIDWIVIGGESGPGARPFDLAWARSTIEACREASVPCFVKQLGARPVDAPRDAGGYVRTTAGGDPWPAQPLSLRDRKGGDMAEWPEDLRVRQWPEAQR